MESSEAARYLITNNWLMTLATADQNGKPWISPVGYTYDDKFNLYWVSSPNAIHSENIKHRVQIAISIVGKLPDGRTDGVYYDAEAEELSDEPEISFAMKIMQKRNQDTKFKIKSLGDVTGEAVWRIYKATPKKVYKRNDTTLKGQAITVRTEVTL